MKNIAERDTDARPTGRPGWRWIKAALLVFLAFALVALAFMIYHAEPILQARIIDTLSARFQSPVQLAEFHVSIDHGFQVSGQGLKIFGKSDLNVHRLGIQPLIAVDEFRFSAGILNLLHAPMRVHRVYLKGLELNIPAREQRSEGISLKGRKIKIYADEFLCEQARLVINTLKPDKLPLEFDISNLEMGKIGPGQPLRFTATLVNPKPVGAIQSNGLFGPWQADDPRSTPVRGKYSFSRADLSTIRGISILPFINDPATGIAKIRSVIADTRISGYQLRDLAPALGHCRCGEALPVLRELASSEMQFKSMEDSWVNAVAALGNTEAGQLLLSFVDPSIPGLPFETKLEREDIITARLVELASRDEEIERRLLELCSVHLPARKRALLAVVVGAIASEEALVEALNLIDDSVTPAIPYELYRSIESIFIEKRPYGNDSNSYTQASRSANRVRNQLFKMSRNDGCGRFCERPSGNNIIPVFQTGANPTWSRQTHLGCKDWHEEEARQSELGQARLALHRPHPGKLIRGDCSEAATVAGTVR